MLVLSRKRGEVIVVPQFELTVTVISVEGNQVRLGFSAPDEIDGYREEVWHKISQTRESPPAES
jgi:carbon storage regulator